MVKGAQRPMASAEAKGAHLVVGWVGPSSSPSSAPASPLQVGARALHTGLAERSIAAVLCHRATLPAHSALCGAAARAAAVRQQRASFVPGTSTVASPYAMLDMPCGESSGNRPCATSAR